MTLTNNMGSMSADEIQAFYASVMEELGHGFSMEFGCAPSICITKAKKIIFREALIDQYPWAAKQEVLHEIAHITTWPEDRRHGEIFHRQFAVLVTRFLGSPLPEWVHCSRPHFPVSTYDIGLYHMDDNSHCSGMVRSGDQS